MITFGSLFSMFGAVILVYTISNIEKWRYHPLLTLLGFIIVLLCLLILYWRYRCSDNPHIDFSLFKVTNFFTGALLRFFLNAVFLGVLIVISLYLQNILLILTVDFRVFCY